MCPHGYKNWDCFVPCRGNAWGRGGTEQAKDAHEAEHRLVEGMDKFQTILQKREHSQFNGNIPKAMKDNKDKPQLQSRSLEQMVPPSCCLLYLSMDADGKVGL